MMPVSFDCEEEPSYSVNALAGWPDLVGMGSKPAANCKASSATNGTGRARLAQIHCIALHCIK